MADELELDISSDETINKTEQRIKDLSSKVKLTSQERDELKTAKEELETANKTLEKERDFYSGFGDQLSKYPGASEFKDAIRDKVMAGYDIEDATVSVLAKEGKLGNESMETQEVQETAPIAPAPAAGGSADISSLGAEPKSADQMSREERRAKLIEADQKGELAEVIRSI